MRAKVIIENGQTEVLLTPENDFEKDIIEKMVDRRKDFSLITQADTHLSYGTHSKHNISIVIKESRL